MGLGMGKSAEPQCARVVVVGAVLRLEEAPGEAALGPSIQGGARAPSAGLTTWAFSVSAITRCIAAMTMGILWSALLARSHLGGVDEGFRHSMPCSISPNHGYRLAEVMAACIGIPFSARTIAV